MSASENSFTTLKGCIVDSESNTHSCVQDIRFVSEMSEVYCHGNRNEKYNDHFRPSTYTSTQKDDQ